MGFGVSSDSTYYPLPQFLYKSRMLYLHTKYTEQLTNVNTSTQKMKEACTSETSATTRRTTQCNNPTPESTPIINHGESLRSVLCLPSFLLPSTPVFYPSLIFPGCLSFLSYLSFLFPPTLPVLVSFCLQSDVKGTCSPAR